MWSALVLLQAFLSLSSSSDPPPPPLLEAASSAGLTTLVDLLDRAGMRDEVDGEVTLLAPTNQAFVGLGEGVLEELKSDTGRLRKMLRYHILPEKVTSTDLFSSNDLVYRTLLDSAPVRINVYLRSRYYQGFLTVNGRRIFRTDLGAGKGIIHTLTEVLYPIPTGDIVDVLSADDEGRFDSFLEAVKAAGLTDLLAGGGGGGGPLTVFAPTREAFEEIGEGRTEQLGEEEREALAETLLRHVLPGCLYRRGTSWGEHDTLATNRQVREGQPEEEEEQEHNRIQTQVFDGGAIKVASWSGSSVRLARVVQTDLGALNGVVHAIDGII